MRTGCRNTAIAPALFGKAHFEPWLGAPETFYENRMARLGETGPHRGFERMELANHFYMRHSHYDVWLEQHHPEAIAGFYPMLTPQGMQNTQGAGATGAIQVWDNPVPREVYHTDWVAHRTIAWLDTSPGGRRLVRVAQFSRPAPSVGSAGIGTFARQLARRAVARAYPRDSETAARWLADKPRHWQGYYDGSLWTNLESPRGFRPCDMTPDQVREINAMNHIENELIDDACGRVLACIERRGWGDDTDVLFTTDHGEFQGDYGLLFKGPYHCDALMRLPLIWRPAPICECRTGDRDVARGPRRSGTDVLPHSGYRRTGLGGRQGVAGL